MTLPFSTLNIESYHQDITLYVKLSAPKDKSWVITVIQVNYEGDKCIRFIQGCMELQDGSLYFNAKSRIVDYTDVTLDGKPTVLGEYYFEKGTIHIFVCKNY